MLKQIRPAYYKVVFMMLCFILIAIIPLSPKIMAGNDDSQQINVDNAYLNGNTPTYLEWLGSKAKNFTNAPALAQRIEIPGESYQKASDQSSFKSGENGLVWNDQSSWVEYLVNIPADGLYNIGLIYDTIDDSSVDMVRKIQIDGATPYVEADNIHLKHSFADANYPFARDEFKNDILPPSLDVKGLRDVRLSDYTVDPQPLKWYLPKGAHTIRLTNVQGAILIKSLYVDAPQQVPGYSQVSKTYPSQDNSASGSKYVQIVEAEKILRKSNTSIQLQSTNDALVTPDSHGFIRYNTIGGEQFRFAGQWVEWEIEVPKDGSYEIGFKYKQSFTNNSNVFESVTIDGATPFNEMLGVRFPYSTNWSWEGKTLSDDQGSPYSFYLTKGKHVLRMTASSGPFKPVYEGLLRGMNRISSLDQQIRKVTGNYEKSYATAGNVDPNRDWQLEKYIPDLQNQLTTIYQDLYSLADQLSKLTTGKSDVETAFRATAADFERMKSQIRTIPSQMQTFENDQQNLSSWAFRLMDQPLLVDYLWVAEHGAKLPQIKPNFFQRIWRTAVNFYHSFTIDYNFTRKDPKAIDVWVNRNRNYVRLIQQLVDQNFTPQTGIHVNVNIVPDANLLVLSNLAGRQPDVALGLDGAMVVDFASRKALADLSKFPGYAQAAQQFSPGALAVFHYDKQNFALPETQNFKVMMYRTDIFDQLGLKPPDTWSDLYDILPTLQQSGHDFYMANDYLPFLYQNGAQLYSADGMTSGLGTNEAYKGFLQWTQLYTLFQIPKEVPSLFNHFRIGDMPIGITDFNTYLLTSVAAPEIAGKWKIAPIPGNKDSQGVVERWAGGALQAGVIYNKSQKKDLSWQFLQWWTSEKTQTQFGNDIEAIYGPEYRWNTANQLAFNKLPWPRDDLKTILDQWQWYKDAPQVPGGYYTARGLVFAWQKVVTSSKIPREELEKAVQDINLEMRRKQVEFHLRDAQGTILHPLDSITIPNPPKGVGP